MLPKHTWKFLSKYNFKIGKEQFTMGDLRKNKFDGVVAELDSQEKKAIEKSEKVVKKITGKSGRKATEGRKVLPTYIPLSMYEKFNAINDAYGISNNAAINMLIRDYITEKQRLLDNI